MADDPDDTRALYQRVIDDIRMRIGIGHLKPGDQLPGAAQLAEEYGYAHMTIQRALQELKRDGLFGKLFYSGSGTKKPTQEFLVNVRSKGDALTQVAVINADGQVDTSSDAQRIVSLLHAQLN